MFQVERRDDLEAAWSPDGHRIVGWTPAKIEEKEQSERIGQAGEHYSLKGWEQDYLFSPSGKSEIHQFCFSERSESTTQTWRQWGDSFGKLLLSIGFLHPPSLVEPIDRIEWKIVSEDDETVTLQGLPRAEQEQRNFRELTVVVSKSNHCMKSIELTDPAQTAQTLISFDEVEIETGAPLPNDSLVFRIPDGGFKREYRIPKMNGSNFRQ